MDVSSALDAIKASCKELEPRFRQLDEQLEEYAPNSAHGISLLQAKSATMLRYLYNLTLYARLRVLGEDVSSVLPKLVEDWVTLERIRPLEKRIRSQISTLLSYSSHPEENDEDAHRPNAAAMVMDEEEAEGDVYRPPRIAEVVYDDEHGEERKAKRESARKERMRRGAHVREMIAEVQGRPEEEGVKMNRGASILKREDEKRTKYEEEHFTRITLSKNEKRRRRELLGTDGKGSAGLTDEIADLVQHAEKVVKKKSASNDDGNLADDKAAKVRALDDITRSMEKDSSTPRKGAKSKRRRKR